MSDFEDCKANLAKKFGISDRDVDEIADRIARERRRMAADPQITRADEELKKFGAEQAEKMRIAASLKRKQASLNIILRDELDRDVGVMMKQGLSPTQAVLAKLVGSWHGVTGARKSIWARRAALEGDWLGGLFKDIMADPDTAHVMRLMRNPKAADPLFRNVVREMRELRPDGHPGATNDRTAQKLAKLFATYSEASRLELNRAGANIGKLDGWSPQSHDVRKLLRVGEDRWLADIRSHLDLERSFPGSMPDEVDGILREVYSNIVTGKDRTLKAARKGELRGPANLARSLEKHRVLHFTSADSWLAYADRYGRGNVATAVLDHLHYAARKASAMQVLGPNPQVFLDAFLEKLQADVRAGAHGLAEEPATLLEKAKAKLRLPAKGPAQKARMEIASLRTDLDEGHTNAIAKAFAEVTGATHSPAHLTAARISAGIRSVQNMTKLGRAVVSSVTDLPIFASRMRFQGRGFFGGYHDAFHALLAGRQKQDQRRLALSLGVFYDSILGDIHSRFSAEDGHFGVMSRASNAFLKLSGLTWWTDRLTNGFARMSSAWMAGHAGKPWAKLDDAYRHVLAIHGIDAQRWDAARQAIHVAEDGTRYILPERVQQLPDEAFGYARNAERERRALELDLLSYFHDEATYGILKGDDRTRMFAVQGTRPGTTLGELWRFIMQFKSFSTAYVQRPLYSTLRGGPGMKPDYVGLAELIAMTTLFGYGAMTAKDFLWNKTPRDPTSIKTIFAALAQGGGLGLYGDFLFAQTDRFGGSPVESAAGPTIGTAGDILKLWGKLKQGDAKASDAFWLALNNTPFLNLWYTRSALDLAILNHMQEMMSPGTFKRREKQMQKDFGQSYIVPPDMLYGQHR